MPPTYKRKNLSKPRLAAVPDADLNLPSLTSKQECFALAVIEGKTAKEAYRACYNCTGSSEETIGKRARELLQNGGIAGFIRSHQRIGLVESVVTRESHLAELARGRELAYENGQISAGVQAEHYRGRVAGLYNDKLALTVGPSDEALLSQVAALMGPDFAQAIGRTLGIGAGEAIELEESPDSQLLRLVPPDGIAQEDQ